MSLSSASTRLLNTPRDGASAASLRSLCHCLRALSAQTFLLIPSRCGMWGKGPQTAYQVQRIAGHGRAVSFWLQTAASLPEAAQHPMQLLSVGAAAVQPLRWRQGFLAPLRLCFLPRFWMSQTATGHQRLPREALETRPWPWSPAVAAAAASLFLHPLPCPSAFLRTPR